MTSATAADVEGLLRFWEEAAENGDRPVDSAAAVLGQIERDPEAVVLAWRDDRIIGSVIAGWDGWRAHIYRLAVHPDARRHGIARLLLDHAEQRLGELGATRIDAMVLDHNALGQSIWAASGYTRQPDWRRWVKPLGSS